MFGASASWVPYSAQYKETDTLNYSNGKQTKTVKIIKEIRSSDGSFAKFEMINDGPVTGEIWMSCGQAASLNYETKQASLTKRDARQHMYIPPDPPLGAITIAGLQATGYPIHMPPGSTGTIWMAMDSEILVKLEYHRASNGFHEDYVKQLESVYMNAVDPDASTKLPSGFSISPGSAIAGTCSSTTSHQ
jgi:hypothetical protein